MLFWRQDDVIDKKNHVVFFLLDRKKKKKKNQVAFVLKSKYVFTPQFIPSVKS